MNGEFLSFHTRGGVSPQGKQRVFVCGHKEDLAQYCGMISGDILNLHDCAIWYEDPDKDYDDETLLSLIDSMSLFVFVVTGRLLSGSDQAIRLVLPFAKENCRAILPIKVDDFDRKLFNSLFDSANYIDKFSSDETAIRYEEKLRIFLSTVLISEDLTKTVREAFKGYIFLSYRKKDRSRAQELIKKIHERDFCRDVAVWYDEYLTPGRNYVDVIRAVMEKCDVFMLGITPNTLAKPNWVLDHEIPDALEANKTIVAAEMSETEKQPLYDQFPALPESISMYDDPALTKALREALVGVDLRRNACDYEHEFNIGLAYLMGIDTEIDHKRGRDLITEAAEHGFLPAVRMLVMMYRTGQGVRMDYREALKWQERETEHYRREMESGTGDGSRYSVSLLALSEAYAELDEKGKSREVLSRFKELIDRYPERFQDRSWFVYYHKMGNIAKDKYQHAEALRCYREALSVAESIAKKDPSQQALQDLALANQMPGMIYRRENNVEAALPYTLTALKILEELDERYHSAETARELLTACIHLGEIQQERGEFDACEQNYKKSLVLAERLHSGKETPSSARDLMVCYIKLADLSEKRGQLQDAMAYGMKALPYAERLYKATQTESAGRDLMENLKLLQNAAEEAGDFSSYCFFREHYIAMYCELLSPDAAAYLYNKAYLYNELGEKCTKAGEYKKAEEYHREALHILIRAEEQYSSYELRREVGITYYDLAKNAIADGRQQQASTWLNTAIKSQEEQFLQTRRAEVCHDIGISYCLLGSLGNTAAYDHAVMLWDHLYQSTGNEQYRRAMNTARKMRDQMQERSGVAEKPSEKKDPRSQNTGKIYPLDQAGLTETERKLAAAAVSTFQDRVSSSRYSAAQLEDLIRALVSGKPMDASLYTALMLCIDSMIRLMKGSEKYRDQCAALESALDKLEKHPPA